MRFCTVGECQLPVFGSDKISGDGFCRHHQYLRKDLDRRSIVQKAVAKKQQSIETKVRSLHPRNVPADTLKEIQDRVDLEKWFKARRKEMTGKCKCGCNNKSSKWDDKYFRYSAAHLFPKSKFKSVRTHPLNWIERSFFSGCHTNLDNQSLDKWVTLADWEDIKNKFYELAPLLTEEERTTKFYSHLESLVYKT